MALKYPGATWKPLGPQTEPRMHAHDIICLHTMVGYLVSTDGYFRVSNGAGYRGTESHFGVGGPWGPDVRGRNLHGSVWQWQDLAYEADANYRDGKRVISIETADNAARPILPWTPEMLDALAHLLAWLASPEAHAACPSTWTCRRAGIPLEIISSTKPGRRGIGYHRQGVPGHSTRDALGNPGLIPGGIAWSGSRGKDCPTDARIRQIPGLLARARELRGQPAAPPAPAPVGRVLYLMTPQMHGEDVRAVQVALQRHGHSPGAADGWFGPATDRAVRSFQAARGLAVDGRSGPVTWAALSAAPPAPAPAPAPVGRVLYLMTPQMHGEDVRAVQVALQRHGHSPGAADGWFGPATDRAVRSFQAARGLAVDGRSGPVTWAALSAAPPAPPAPARRVLRLTTPQMSGDDVRALQAALRRHGDGPGAADGWFGPATDRAVRSFQRARGLAVDGRVGPVTWAALGIG